MIFVERGLIVDLFYIICLYSILVDGLDQNSSNQNVSTSTYNSRRSQSPPVRESNHTKPQVNNIQNVTTIETRNSKLTRTPSSEFNLRKNNATISKRSQVTNRANQYDSSSSESRQQQQHHHHQQQQQQQDDTRVPFWSIAHMINSIEQVGIALSAGSNGIETDVSFNSQGIPVEAYHGFPCDCGRHCHFREDFVRFVKYVGEITSPPVDSQLLLVLFDLKLKDLKEARQKRAAGLYLAKMIHENVYSRYELAVRQLGGATGTGDNSMIRPPVRIIISINHASDHELVRAFIGYMRDHRLDFMQKHVGFDVGMNDKLEEITAMWDGLKGATSNIWQGDGLTNCANLVRGVERLKEAISVRNGQGHFRKVYYWTADILYHIRSVLRLGIDAVLTNQPQRVLQVLQEEEFRSKYRLATPYDDPYDQFWIRPSAWKMSVPSIGEAVETVTNIHKTSANFVKTLPDGISAAFKKVHSTISSAIR